MSLHKLISKKAEKNYKNKNFIVNKTFLSKKYIQTSFSFSKDDPSYPSFPKI